MGYVPLHNHTIFSLLDGLIKPEDLAKASADLGFSACAITDHGSISGAIRFYQACKEHNVKPIIGIEAYFCDDATKRGKEEKSYHIIILAKSNRGLKSIFKLMSKAHDHFYRKPRIDMDMFYDTEDLIVSTACLGGILSHPNYEKVVEGLYDYFEDDLYLEIMPVELDQQREVNVRAFELSQRYPIKLIATNDTHYLKEEQHDLHNFLLNLKTRGKMSFEIEGLFLRNEGEMREAFVRMADIELGHIVEALNNTQEIADKCNVEWPKSKVVLPKLSERPPAEKLEAILEEKSKDKKLNKEYKARLAYELQVLKDKNFCDYFLLVYDIVEFARSVNMQLGKGRGSAGGSLICYLLGITGVDPIKEDLLFERFLNPERTDEPDIDLDFQRSRRHEIIEYLREKYGEERVSYISTVSELKTKSAFKDVARQLGISFLVANQLASYIEEEHKAEVRSLAEIVADNPIFEQKIDAEILLKLIHYTDGISGTLRHVSKHAAGIVVAPSRIDDFGILERAKEEKEEKCINWTMNDVSYQGLVKIDVLGLRSLDVFAEAVELIEKRHHKNIDWEKVDTDSDIVLTAFGKGDTIGIFQFEQNSTRRLVKKLSPITSKGVLIDCNALVRPGPLDSGMTAKYVDRHHGKIEYDEPYIKWLIEGPGEKIASKTYNVLIYQEQVIQVLQLLAGYTIPQADLIRRIFAKKKGDMDAHRDEFIAGSEKTVGMPADAANALYDNLITFSRYGFNKSHAAAYTILGLEQMWMKLHYGLEYMTALFKWTPEEDKKKHFPDECRKLGIELRNPDINLSEAGFSIDNNAIRIGLSAIAGIGDKTLSYIQNQKRVGSFKDILDFRHRVPKGQVDKTALKNLIMTGCFGNQINANRWVAAIDECKDKEALQAAYARMDGVRDFDDETKEMQKAALLKGIYKMNLEPETGLNIDVEELEGLREIIMECRDCELCEAYKFSVPMEYTDNSRIMIVAEAPGEDEVAQGRPLIGKAGQGLMTLLRSMGLSRTDCYLTNVYKHRPSNNKLPPNTPKNCWEILKREIEILQPKLIVALGNRAREFFTGQKSGINEAADKLLCEPTIIENRPINVLYGVHPASMYYENGAEQEARLRETIKLAACIHFKIEDMFQEEEEAIFG